MSIAGRESGDLAAALAASYRRVTAALEGLDPLDHFGPTRCRGMAVADLVVHLRMDAERAVMAFAQPTDAVADTDFATYWRDFSPLGEAPQAAFDGVRQLRAWATAYRPEGLRQHWNDLSTAAADAALQADARAQVPTQGMVLDVPDFIATLVLEACVHTLDLQPSVEIEPEPAAVAVTVATLDRLAGADLREVTGWDDLTYVLTATGRVAPSDPDVDRLGPLAERLPLLG